MIIDSRTNQTRRPRRAGFTLFEVLSASVILAMAVIALTQAVVAGQMQTHAAMRSGRAVSLCEAMIEEILTHDYPPADVRNFGADVGEPRSEFDHIGDYHGFDEPVGTVVNARGDRYPSPYERFSRSVTVTDGQSVDLPSADGPITVEGITITVTVRDGPTGRMWTVERFVPKPQQSEQTAS